MTREQLEHAIRAASSIADDDELYIVGSQSILGKFPNAPAALRQSMEVDIAPKNKPEAEEMIEGAIGELSLFHDTYGYFVDGVSIEAIKLPEGWQARLVNVSNANTRGAHGLCLDPCDLAISKLWAAREKDRAFVKVMLQEGLLSFAELSSRIAASGFEADDCARLQTLAGAFHTTYLRVRWAHENADEPVLQFSELDAQRMEIRKLEIFRDGRCGYASREGSSLGTRLGTAAVPEVSDIARDSEFEPTEITQAEFAALWAKSVT